MDKATSKRALRKQGSKASGRALAREDEDGTRERILRTRRTAVRRAQFSGYLCASSPLRRKSTSPASAIISTTRKACCPASMPPLRTRDRGAAARARRLHRAARQGEGRRHRRSVHPAGAAGRSRWKAGKHHPSARRAIGRELRAAGKAGGGELRSVQHRVHRRAVRMLPHLSRTDVCWRFHFLLGSIYYTAAGPHRISAFSNGRCNPANTEDVIKELVPFMTRAFQAPPTNRNGRAQAAVSAERPDLRTPSVIVRRRGTSN